MPRYFFTIKIDSAFKGKRIVAVLPIELEVDEGDESKAHDLATEFAETLFSILYKRFNIITIDQPKLLHAKEG